MTRNGSKIILQGMYFNRNQTRRIIKEIEERLTIACNLRFAQGGQNETEA